MEHAGLPPMSRRLFGLGGGVMFIGSLLVFLAQYRWRFGTQPAAPDGIVRPTLIDLAIFTLFALHHSVFARTALKAWVRTVVPPTLERSAYVWIASVLFLATCAAWQLVPGDAWRVTGVAGAALEAGQLAGLGWTAYSARRFDLLELAGVRQTRRPALDPLEDPVLLTGGPYRVVRHPIYFGWLLLVWLTPAMTATRLVFAAVSTLYLAVAIPFEERDLARTFGDAYGAYRRRVRWRMLPFVY